MSQRGQRPLENNVWAHSTGLTSFKCSDTVSAYNSEGSFPSTIVYNSRRDSKPFLCYLDFPKVGKIQNFLNRLIKFFNRN